MHGSCIRRMRSRCIFFGKVVVLLLPVVPEDRLEHILRIGGLLGTFAAKMAHTEPDELRLQLFIVAVLQVPQCQRRKEVLPFQALDGIRVQPAGGDQHESPGLTGIFLHIDLRHHAAVARAGVGREHPQNSRQRFLLRASAEDKIPRKMQQGRKQPDRQQLPDPRHIELFRYSDRMKMTHLVFLL